MQEVEEKKNWPKRWKYRTKEAVIPICCRRCRVAVW
ncbi:hypothetical protein V6Z12_D11G360700 [Gossypium hirsutum]